MSRSSVFALIILAAIVGSLAGAVVTYSTLERALKSEIALQFANYSKLISSPAPAENDDSSSKNIASNPSSSDTLLSPDEKVVTDVYRKASPSVVHVTTIQYARNIFFQIIPQEGTGSGFIFSKEGYVLTNNHVIEGAQEVSVRLADGSEYEARIVGTDDFTDIAVLQLVNADIPPEWVAELGDSDTLQVGQKAIAIGNPFGFDYTVTVGVISALNRPLATEQTSYENMIQTDASINPGNSGGPLLNSKGQVIGINAVIFSQSGGSQGVGFAIPINIAKKVSADLIQYGRVRRPSVGFQGFTLGPNLARALGIPVDHGILVQYVDPTSSVAEAGLRGGTRRVLLRDRFRQFAVFADGDVIIKLNGERVDEISAFANKIRRMELGTVVTLTVVRDGKEIDLHWTLRE